MSRLLLVAVLGCSAVFCKQDRHAAGRAAAGEYRMQPEGIGLFGCLAEVFCFSLSTWSIRRVSGARFQEQPDPEAYPERTARLIAYIYDYYRWKCLPWWKRIIHRPPQRPAGM
jgi:hypothetical protein